MFETLASSVPETKAQWIGFAVYFVCHSMMEFWFGKTEKTRAGSLVEFILNLFKKKEKPNGN